MIGLPISLAVIACVANAVKDEIQFRWSRLFGNWFKPGTKLEKWFNPSISWQNKYLFKSSFLNFIVGSAFVMFTDFWHLLKFITINSVIGVVLLTSDVDLGGFWDYLVAFLGLNVAWGLCFETATGIMGGLSDIYTFRKNKRNLKINEQGDKRSVQCTR